MWRWRGAGGGGIQACAQMLTLLVKSDGALAGSQVSWVVAVCVCVCVCVCFGGGAQRLRVRDLCESNAWGSCAKGIDTIVERWQAVK
mgnify:CR=1 FL=1